MSRTISVDRLYSLGDYRNIRFVDTLEDTEGVFKDEDVIQLVKNLQFQSAELAYRNYIKLAKEIVDIEKNNPDDKEAMVIEHIEQQRLNTLEQIKNYLEKGE
jgi:hypothetical protein